MDNCYLKVYQVNAGDCMSLRYKGNDGMFQNVFIDCGYSGTFDKTLGKEISNIILNDEKINLFVLTHTHQDHIGGMSKYIKKYSQEDIVEKFWFNGGRLLINTDISNKISVNQGYELDKYLLQTGRGNLEKVVLDDSNIYLHGSNISVINPTKEILNRFLISWNMDYSFIGNEKITTAMCDWGRKISEFTLEEFVEDTDDDNKCSISFIFSYDQGDNSKKILFLADSVPSIITGNLRKLGYSNENKLKVSYTKLSHHASKGNTSNELLDILECNNFIISTSGMNRDKFPHKETFARILRHPMRDKNKKIKFYFNYDTPELRSIFEEFEYELYNFECVYAEKGMNYLAISI